MTVPELASKIPSNIFMKLILTHKSFVVHPSAGISDFATSTPNPPPSEAVS